MRTQTVKQQLYKITKVLFVCAEESRSASNNSLFMTEEAGETFNHDLQSYKTDYFVSRAMYAPFGAAVNCVPPTDAARAAALIRRLPTYGRVLICRLSAIEPPSGGTPKQGTPRPRPRVRNAHHPVSHEEPKAPRQPYPP